MLKVKPCTPEELRDSYAFFPFALARSSWSLTALIELERLLYLIPASAADFSVIPIELDCSILFCSCSCLNFLNAR